MNCAWKELLEILPPWLGAEADRYDRDTLQELRLRINAPPEFISFGKVRTSRHTLTQSDLRYCVNAASKFSPWAAATSEKGYLTAPGGHRIGICGQAVMTPEQKVRIRDITSLCIRVARDYPGIAQKAGEISGSVLILGAPGWGKTTLLRDLCRRISQTHTLCIADERYEVFPPEIPRGGRMDVLSGCPKAVAVELLLRTMGPSYIAVDEITAREDCEAMLRSANCGVHLLATAHGTSVKDFFSRPVYQPLAQARLFTTFLVLHRDKTYTVERVSS